MEALSSTRNCNQHYLAPPLLATLIVLCWTWRLWAIQQLQKKQARHRRKLNRSHGDFTERPFPLLNIQQVVGAYA